MAKKKSAEIPLVPVPKDMWKEMLERAGNDPTLARWIWSCWQAIPESNEYYILEDSSRWK